MAIHIKDTRNTISPGRFLGLGFILMTAVVCVGLIIALLNSEFDSSYPYLFLLPWILGLAVVLATPTVILRSKGKFTFYHPLVFATWSYFFPAFVLGGLMLVFGWSQPSFLSFLQDARQNLPFTIELVILGFSAFAVGMMIPAGNRAGRSIADFLPKHEYELSSLILPSLILLLSGFVNSIIAFVLGVIGYQKAAEIGSYDGLIFLTTLFWMQASFVLWYIVFKRNRVDPLAVLIVLTLLATAIAKALIAGNRGSFLQLFVIIGFAYVLSGQRVNLKRGVAAGIFLAVCLLVGMIYGTTFRYVKGTESQTSVEIYTENIFETFDQVGRRDNTSTLEFALINLAERLDAVSSVGVVVSNYEQLKPYEESYGLDNNIWNDTVTFLVPRLIWPDKPVASDARKYSELYFDYGDNSFAITPIGDLLRNFGVIGVPIGMFILGVFLRIIYRALIEGQPITIWRATLFFMLIIAVSYEGFFGSILPYMFKVGVFSVVGIIFVNFFGRRTDVGVPGMPKASRPWVPTGVRRGLLR
jgi:oligosaccharide repeat unit polymerase